MSARRNVRRTGPGVRPGRTVLAALVLAGSAALAGCGAQQAGGPSTTAGGNSAGPVDPTAGGGSLTVVLDDGGGGDPRTWEVSCPPDGAGADPGAQDACAAVAAAVDPWAPVAPGTACTMVFGGPEVATVRGTWDGAEVDTRFERSDGCEIARWDRVAPLLRPGAVPGPSSDVK